MPITPDNPFNGRHYSGEVILLAVRWYLRYPLAYGHVAERGLAVYASCVWRWGHAYREETGVARQRLRLVSECVAHVARHRNSPHDSERKGEMAGQRRCAWSSTLHYRPVRHPSVADFTLQSIPHGRSAAVFELRNRTAQPGFPKTQVEQSPSFYAAFLRNPHGTAVSFRQACTGSPGPVPAWRLRSVIQMRISAKHSSTPFGQKETWGDRCTCSGEIC